MPLFLQNNRFTNGINRHKFSFDNIQYYYELFVLTNVSVCTIVGSQQTRASAPDTPYCLFVFISEVKM